MLIRAEKIVSDIHDNILVPGMSEQEIAHIFEHDLSKKLITKMIDEKLIKFESTLDYNDSGEICLKLRATVRVYNPDD